MFYDRQGRPIDMLTMSKLFVDLDYKQVARDYLPDGRLVSTVWLGVNYNWLGGPPHIFETMVFPKGSDGAHEYCERYATEADALSGHARIVAAIRQTGQVLHDAMEKPPDDDKES